MKKSRRTSGTSWAVDSYFLWDGEQLLAELDSAGHRKSDYIYYPGTDQPYAVTLGATTPTSVKLIEQDALGDVIGTIDGTSVSERVSYDSWGVPSVSGNADSRLLWKGLLWEGDAVALYYMRNRWYDPELGRFMSEDPIGHEGGDNLYAFANDDPINGSDPTGTCPKGYMPSPGENGRIWCLPPAILNPFIIYGTPEGINPRGASCDLGFEENFATCTWQRWAGPTRAEAQPVRDDAGARAVGVCRAAIGLTAVSFFLESVGVAELYKGAKGLASLRATAHFAATFGSVPAAIQSYTRGRVISAELGMARNYAGSWAQMSAISYGTEAAAGMEHAWWGYLPIPYSSTIASGVSAARACFSPGG